MNDPLQVAANIAQIVGVVWTLLLGGKTLFDLRKQQNQQLAARGHFPWSLLTNALSFIIIIALLSINVVLVHVNSNGTSFTLPGFSHASGSSVIPLPGTPLSSGPPLTPSAMVSSGGRAYNTQLACSARSCVDYLQITLFSSTVNVEKKHVVLSFTILDTSGDQGFTANSYMDLQSALDQSPYIGYTQTDSGPQEKMSFSVTPGNLAQIIVNFDFVPYKGVSYQLLVYIQDTYGSRSFSLDPVLLTF